MQTALFCSENSIMNIMSPVSSKKYRGRIAHTQPNKHLVFYYSNLIKSTLKKQNTKGKSGVHDVPVLYY